MLELGPGPGTATRRLLELGADPVVAVEPNETAAAYLVEATGGAVEALVAPFEDVRLSRSFDLVVAATSVRWIDPEPGLPKVFAAPRSGGWFAMWSNIHGDMSGEDAFHRATQGVLGDARGSMAAIHRRRSERANALVGGLPRRRLRAAAVEPALRPGPHLCALRDVLHVERRPAGERDRILDELERIAAVEFEGVVERAILTTLYTA